MFKYLRIENRREGETLIPLDEISLNGIALSEKLLTGEPVEVHDSHWTDLQNRTKETGG